ncbi:MAG TPA: cation-transporting P-type ATPase, partial [Steroidobacteraceae bacterium]|nr:cation-transporting P-type ATPase [Steroidobacteraceae bacterium]
MPVDAQSAHGRESGARDERHSLGLTQAEAARRLAAIGANAMPREVSRPGLRLLRKFWAPVPWMLEVAIVLQLALGEYIE